jgi:hypothetical protein
MVGALTALTTIMLLKTHFPDLPGWFLMLAGMAVATLGAHLTVIGALGAQDLWRVIRKPPQLRRSPRAAVADATE